MDGAINLKSGPGVIASASPDPSINGTDIEFDADIAVLQIATPSGFVASSSGTGMKYTATTNPVISSYASLAPFVMIPDVPTQPGATLDLGPGPVAIQGTCSQICLLLAFGNPVSAFVVH